MAEGRLIHYGARRFFAVNESVATPGSIAVGEIFLAMTRTALLDQVAASSLMNRVDDTSDTEARPPALAPLTVTSISDVAPGARLGRSQDASATSSHCSDCDCSAAVSLRTSRRGNSEGRFVTVAQRAAPAAPRSSCRGLSGGGWWGWSDPLSRSGVARRPNQPLDLCLGHADALGDHLHAAGRLSSDGTAGSIGSAEWGSSSTSVTTAWPSRVACSMRMIQNPIITRGLMEALPLERANVAVVRLSAVMSAVKLKSLQISP